MGIFRKILNALWYHDFEKLFSPNIVLVIYLLIFIILFFENALLPTAFLPGDSLLILIGVLIEKETLSFPMVLFILTIAVSSGSWVSYIQGKWLENTPMVKEWLKHLPVHYNQRAYRMFHRHGFSALLIGRFVAFVRTLLPTVAGLSGLASRRFHLANWISSFLWVLSLTLVGFMLGRASVFKRYESTCMMCLLLFPLVMLTIGLISSFLFTLRRKRIGNSSRKW